MQRKSKKKAHYIYLLRKEMQMKQSKVSLLYNLKNINSFKIFRNVSFSIEPIATLKFTNRRYTGKLKTCNLLFPSAFFF